MTFTFDFLGHPLTIVGSDNQTDYVYSADGRKLRATHTQYTFKKDTLAVCYYFIQDYQGNNRILIGSNGQRDQYSHYYPYGGLMGDISTNDAHSYKYGGKELDRDFGIDLFDLEARQYDAKVPGFTSIDPLAEKYYGISPYAYCAGDPVNCVDPTGMYTYTVDSTGVITRSGTADDPNVLCGTDINNESCEESITDNQAAVLDDIIESQENDASQEGTPNRETGSVIKRKEAKKLFKLLADFSNVEWQLVAYTDRFVIGTSHQEEKSPELNDLKNFRWSIHSHPASDGTMGPSGGNKYRLWGDYSVAYDRYKKLGVSMPHFVYHRYSGRVYYYNPWSYCRTYFFE